MAALYIVGTPIGNLEDITLRALRVLKECDVILCEDTRVTKRLLDRFEITNKQLAIYNEEKSGVKIEKIIDWIKEGKNLALVTDAGTPGISDPGAHLVAKIQEYFSGGLKVEAVPGPSALTAALSVAGIPATEFVFLGFLPHKKGRETIFKGILNSKFPTVFFESTHRILKTFESLSKILDENREIAVVKELTKIHERVIKGKARHVLNELKNDKNLQKGEFVVIVSGC